MSNEQVVALFQDQDHAIILPAERQDGKELRLLAQYWSVMLLASHRPRQPRKATRSA